MGSAQPRKIDFLEEKILLTACKSHHRTIRDAMVDPAAVFGMLFGSEVFGVLLQEASELQDSQWCSAFSCTKSHNSSSRFGFKSNPFFRTQTPRFFKCLPQRLSDEHRETQVTTEEEEEKLVEFERLFSNLNPSTLKRESGSLSSAIFLVAGTNVGAWILAIPAVTQESGFLASAVACILCWAFMVVTGLLVAEVNVNTMSELGSGGVSLVSMAKRTLGSVRVQVASWSYILIHYTLLVAYIARSSGSSAFQYGRVQLCSHWFSEAFASLEG